MYGMARDHKSFIYWIRDKFGDHQTFSLCNEANIFHTEIGRKWITGIYPSILST